MLLLGWEEAGRVLGAGASRCPFGPRPHPWFDGRGLCFWRRPSCIRLGLNRGLPFRSFTSSVGTRAFVGVAGGSDPMISLLPRFLCALDLWRISLLNERSTATCVLHAVCIHESPPRSQIPSRALERSDLHLLWHSLPMLLPGINNGFMLSCRGQAGRLQGSNKP